MARPHKCRWISTEPGIQVFKPKGIPAKQLEAVELRLDELEALRLADSEGLYHEKAAEQMRVSRATFGRLVMGARRKVADVLINGKMLVIKGGNVAMPSERNFECLHCRHSFQLPFGTGKPEKCLSCGSKDIYRVAE